MSLFVAAKAIKHHLSANIRLVLLCFVAVSPSLGTAISALGRLVLFGLALAVIIFTNSSERTVQSQRDESLKNSISWIVLVAIAYMALSLLWTSTNDPVALNAWTRHARLIAIPVVYLLIYTYGEARTVLRFFVIGQIFVMLSAWLLVWGVAVPWATAKTAVTSYAVFGSYLEQSISQAVLIAIAWHQRDWILGRGNQWWAIGIATLTLIHTLGFLIGRSGHLVALVVIVLAVIYELPTRLKWASIFVPVLLIAGLAVSSQKFLERTYLLQDEVKSYYVKANTSTSSGQRLLFWETSLNAIKERPVLGHGTGSWNKEYTRLASEKADITTLTTDNPHQMFLLWAVEAGIVGLLMLCWLIVALLIRSRKMAPNDARTLQSVVAALIVAGMFNSPLYGIGIGDFFCVGLGICLALIHGGHSKAAQSTHA